MSPLAIFPAFPSVQMVAFFTRTTLGWSGGFSRPNSPGGSLSTNEAISGGLGFAVSGGGTNGSRSAALHAKVVPSGFSPTPFMPLPLTVPEILTEPRNPAELAMPAEPARPAESATRPEPARPVESARWTDSARRRESRHTPRDPSGGVGQPGERHILSLHPERAGRLVGVPFEHQVARELLAAGKGPCPAGFHRGWNLHFVSLPVDPDLPDLRLRGEEVAIGHDDVGRAAGLQGAELFLEPEPRCRGDGQRGERAVG